jgi:hypothetical protein
MQVFQEINGSLKEVCKSTNNCVDSIQYDHKKPQSICL